MGRCVTGNSRCTATTSATPTDNAHFDFPRTCRMTLMIHRIHGLGPEAARHFLSAPRHEIVISDIVARRLDQFRISRELQTPDLALGDDPDDAEPGLLLLANA